MKIKHAGSIRHDDPTYQQQVDPQEAFDKMRTLVALHRAGGELHFGVIAERLGDPLDTSVIERANAVLANLIGNGLVSADPEVPTLHRLTTPSGRALAAMLAT